MTFRKTIPVLVLCLLTGCSFCEKPSANPTIPPLESSLTDPCRKIPDLPEAAAVDTVIEWGLEVIDRYTDCAVRKQTVTDIYNQVKEGTE